VIDWLDGREVSGPKKVGARDEAAKLSAVEADLGDQESPTDQIVDPERWRRREATGDMIIVRYADDIVVGFQHEIDARRFWDAMRERLLEFSLSLHPEKTRLIEFGRYAAANRKRRGLGKPETFNFLGYVSSALMLHHVQPSVRMLDVCKIDNT
jgi:hypothetical protein